VADNARLEELRRRVQKDPASIAFAQLAEECRRAGEYEEAVEVSRAGLEQHPAYLSARVTLGRSLFELGRLDEAGTEFAQVLASAPDNVIALRALAEIHQQTRTRGHIQAQQRARDFSPDEAGTDEGGQWTAWTAPPGLPPDLPSRGGDPERQPPAAPDPVVAELEAWLEVIAEQRVDRRR